MQTKKTILVVDSSDASLSITKEVLERDCNIMTTSSCAKAIELMDKNKPDLILIDITTSEVDGFAFLENLKNIERHKCSPVIFLTARCDEDLEFQGRLLGAVDFITKPFCAITFRKRVELHLPQFS